MIEKALLIENVDAVLVGVDHKGELHWMGASVEGMRDILEMGAHPPNLHWYRVGLDGWTIHAAANGTPKYRLPAGVLYGTPSKAKHVKNFVENLRKVSV